MTNLRNKVTQIKDITEKFIVVEQWLIEMPDEKKAPPQEIVDIIIKLLEKNAF